LTWPALRVTRGRKTRDNDHKGGGGKKEKNKEEKKKPPCQNPRPKNWEKPGLKVNARISRWHAFDQSNRPSNKKKEKTGKRTANQ